MAECKKISDKKKVKNREDQLDFSFTKSLHIRLDFGGGDITSDSGFLLIREEDRKQNLCQAVASVINDKRDERYTVHSVLDLIRQRVYQIAAGYEDANDSNSLRKDPLLKACVGNRKPADFDLASQPTISRLENRTDEYELMRIMKVLVNQYISKRKKPPTYIVLDIDPTDDPCHGNQQCSFWHGYYEENMYHDLLIFDGETGELITPILRPGSVHGADGVREVLLWLLPQLKEAWPDVSIMVRADGGLASPRVYELLEEYNCFYVIGLITNKRLLEMNKDALNKAVSFYTSTNKTHQVLTEFNYQAGSWKKPRRVIGKAECLQQGPNQRFVVTNFPHGVPEAVYGFYKQRGEGAENRIKEWKNMIKGDRLSCHEFYPNWFRMLLYTMAYELIRGMRESLVNTEFERSTINTIRLKILKVGALIKKTTRRLWVHCSSAYPYKDVWLYLYSKYRYT